MAVLVDLVEFLILVPAVLIPPLATLVPNFEEELLLTPLLLFSLLLLDVLEHVALLAPVV